MLQMRIKVMFKKYFLVTAVSLFLGILLLCGSNASNVYAEYPCGTYGSDSYGAGDVQSYDSCSPQQPSYSPPTGAFQTENSNSKPVRSAGANETGRNGADGQSAPVSQPLGADSVTLNDYPEYVDGTGIKISMKPGQKVYFTVGSMSYMMTLKSVNADSVLFVLEVSGLEITVPYGNTVGLDANRDGKNDLSLNYKSKNEDGETAALSFAAINEDKKGQSNASSRMSAQDSVPRSWTVFGVIIAVVLLLGIILAIIKFKRKGQQE